MKNNNNKKIGFFSEFKRNRDSYLLIAPFTLIFFVFTVIPVLVTIAISFTNYNVLEMPKFVGWDNYRRLLVNDEIFLKAIKNTLVYAIITGPFGFLLSFFASWAINGYSRSLKGFLTFIFYVPTISGMVFTIWSIIFSGDMYGYANSFLLQLGIITDPIQWFTTERYILPIIIAVQLWMSMGVGFLAMRAGMSSIDAQYYEAGKIDGIKSRIQELWYITIPMMAPHLMTATVLQISSMFANANVAQTLAGFPSTNYAGHLIMTHLNDYSVFRVERGYASSISVLLFIFMMAINLSILRLLRKVND